MNTRIKNGIIGTALMTLLFGVNASANEQLINSLECINGVITIRGTAGANENVVMRMQREGTELRDYNSVYALKEVQSDENGDYTFSFVMPDYRSEESTKGEYIIKVISDSGEQEKKYLYSSKTERDEFFSTLNASNNAYELKNTILAETKDFLLTVGIQEDFLNESDEIVEETCRLMFEEYMASGKDSVALHNVIEKYVHIARINCLNEQDIASALNKRNPNGVSGCYADMNDEKRNFIAHVMFLNRPYNTENVFLNYVEKADALFEICNAKYTAIADTIEKYSTLLDIDREPIYTNYVSASNKIKISQILTEKLKKTRVYNVSELIQAISYSIQEAVTTTPAPSGGGTGGNGSKIKVDNVKPILDTKNDDTKKEEISFIDMANTHWASKHIAYLVSKKIISGYDDGSFRPDNFVTREEFAVMTTIAAGIPLEISDSVFMDVPNDAWYKKYVSAAVKAGIVNGVSDKMFGSGQNITRQDAAVMLCKALGRTSDYDITKIADCDEIADYALSSVKSLYSDGILSGNDKGEFNPKTNITRAEAATMISIAYGGNVQ